MEPLKMSRMNMDEPSQVWGAFDGMLSWMWNDPTPRAPNFNGPRENTAPGVVLVAAESVTAAAPSNGKFLSHRPADVPVPAAADHRAAAVASSSSLPLPQFTSRDEEREFASLTTEEIVAGELDVLGLTADMASATIQDDAVGEAGLVAALHAELALLPGAEKAAYEEATRRCPELVDEEHKKAFLWREGYDAKLAAKRLVKYWSKRLALFGQDKCYLPLTLVGALRDDVPSLKSGVIQVLPELDESGRSVLFWDAGRYDPAIYSLGSMLRASWYLFHVAANDPVVQRRGFVMIVIPNGSVPSLPKMELNRSIAELEEIYLPALCRATHYCQPGRFFHMVNPVIKYFMGKRLRERFKVHYGSQEKVLKSLEEYGLSWKVLPTELGGNATLCPVQWLSNRLAEECRSDNSVSAAPDVQGQVNISPPPVGNENDFAWEPIKIGSGSVSTAIHRPREQSTASRQESSSGSVSLHNELASASAFRRRRDRQIHVDSSSGTDEESKVSFSSNERLVEETTESTSFVKRTRVVGCRGDPRMNNAVKAKQDNPELSPVEALLRGGFVFPRIGEPGMTDITLLDTDNVTLHQRKCQFRRRMKKPPKKNVAVDGESSRSVVHIGSCATNTGQSEIKFDSIGTERDVMVLQPNHVLHRASENCTNDSVVTDVSPSKCHVEVSRTPGSKGDLRMNKAVQAKLERPHLSDADALLEGGFVFPRINDPNVTDITMLDTDGMPMLQRKNQLRRRIRNLKKKRYAGKETLDAVGCDNDITADSDTLLLGTNDLHGFKGVKIHESGGSCDLHGDVPTTAEAPLHINSGGSIDFTVSCRSPVDDAYPGKRKRADSFDTLLDSVLQTDGVSESNS